MREKKTTPTQRTILFRLSVWMTLRFFILWVMKTAEEAGLLARATFGWVGPLVGLGFKSPVVLDDLWALQGTNAAASLEGAVGAGAKARPTWRVLLSVARRRLLTALFFACIYATTQVGPRARHTQACRQLMLSLHLFPGWNSGDWWHSAQ